MDGPSATDSYTEVRTNNQTITTVDGTVALSAALAALIHTGTTQQSCELHGIYNRYVGGDGSLS